MQVAERHLSSTETSLSSSALKKDWEVLTLLKRLQLEQILEPVIWVDLNYKAAGMRRDWNKMTSGNWS
jgi:hypothetical protein